MAQASTEYAKPLPAMVGLTKEFYDWCRRGELRFQRCTGCGAWRHVPRLLCPGCGSWEGGGGGSSGRGTVFTWTVAARAIHPAFQGEVPYAAVVVAMEEGVRILSRVIDCPIEELGVDMPVEAVFQHATPEVTLPYFRRLSEKE